MHHCGIRLEPPQRIACRLTIHRDFAGATPTRSVITRFAWTGSHCRYPLSPRVQKLRDILMRLRAEPARGRNRRPAPSEHGWSRSRNISLGSRARTGRHRNSVSFRPSARASDAPGAISPHTSARDQRICPGWRWMGRYSIIVIFRNPSPPNIISLVKEAGVWAGRVDHRHRYRIEVREGGLQTLRWSERTRTLGPGVSCGAEKDAARPNRLRPNGRTRPRAARDRAGAMAA
jgi:hypothetical protein